MTMAKEFKPQGYKCVCNNGGYEIELDERGERARFRLFGDTVTRWTMVRYNAKGEPFCNTRVGRQYLKDYMRL